MSPTLAPTLAHELSSWLDHLQAQERAPSTLRDYEADVRAFVDWKQSTGGDLAHFGEATAEDAQAYRAFLLVTPHATKGRNLSAATVNRRLGTMASLVDFLAREAGMACRNPFRAVKKVTLARGAPRALTQNEWNGVRRAASAWEEKDGGLALAVVSMLRHAGLRAGELAALRADDVEVGMNSGQVRILQGKGLKARTVPLNTEAREGIASWRAARASVLSNLCVRLAQHGAPIPPWADDTRGAFLVGQRGPFTRRGLGMITEKLGEQAGLLAPLSPHQLRHTFAAAAVDPAGYGLARQPMPLAALQCLMGHAHVETTAVYARFSDGDLERFLEEDL